MQLQGAGKSKLRGTKGNQLLQPPYLRWATHHTTPHHTTSHLPCPRLDCGVDVMQRLYMRLRLSTTAAHRA